MVYMFLSPHASTSVHTLALVWGDNTCTMYVHFSVVCSLPRISHDAHRLLVMAALHWVLFTFGILRSRGPRVRMCAWQKGMRRHDCRSFASPPLTAAGVIHFVLCSRTVIYS